MQSHKKIKTSAKRPPLPVRTGSLSGPERSRGKAGPSGAQRLGPQRSPQKQSEGGRSGFTLIELIIVIAIIAILAGAIFVAIDPARRLHEVRNSRRASDIATILDAVKKYQADNDGVHFTTVAAMTDDQYYQIGSASTGCAMTCGLNNTLSTCVNLADIGSNYLADVPRDPQNGTYQQTKYAISKTSTGTITVEACGAEGEGAGGSGSAPQIKVTR